MPATYQTDGAQDCHQPGNDTGAACTGIGFGGNYSGQPVPGNFSIQTSPLPGACIGMGSNASSNDSLATMVIDVTFTAGSGYNNGVFNVESDASGGAPAKISMAQFTVTGGAIAAAKVIRAGNDFTGTPTFTLANAYLANGQSGGVGSGTGGALTAVTGSSPESFALGAAYGSGKSLMMQQAAATIAQGATGTGLNPYYNRSPRTANSGDFVASVSP